MKNVKNTIGFIKSRYLYSTPPVLRTSPPQRGGKDVIDPLDLDLIISHVIKKEREFVLAHPEYILNKKQELQIKNHVDRRLKNEPLAYILGEKEFYSLNFKVNRYTLIPRPETELMVEMALDFIKTNKQTSKKITPVCRQGREASVSERSQRFHGNTAIGDLEKENRSRISDFSTAHSSQEKCTFWDDIAVIDVGTGSGNIIISLAHSIEQKEAKNYKKSGSVNCEPRTVNYIGIDLSKKALKIAKQNAKLNKVDKNIKFLHGNLLDSFLNNLQATNYKLQATSLLVLANLPYLSADIYNACADNVKKYEPKSALYSAKAGLSHYDKLLKQIKLLATSYQLPVTALLEISPEQKKILPTLVKKYFPKAKIGFKKDLAQKWRVCKVEI